MLVHIFKHTQKTYWRWFYIYLPIFSAFVSINGCDKLDPKKAAKILLNALNISAFASITMWTKLYFNMAVKIWLNALNISADTQRCSKNLQPKFYQMH